MQVNTTIDSAIASILPKIRLIAKTLDSKNAEDLTQDVLLKLLEMKPDVRRLESSGWLNTAIRSKFIDRLRAEKREAQYLDRSVSLDLSGSVCEGLNEHKWHMPRTLEPQSTEDCSIPIVRDALQELPEEQRQVLVLLAADYSYPEIARITGTRVGTVRSRIHYARKRAQELLRPVLS